MKRERARTLDEQYSKSSSHENTPLHYVDGRTIYTALITFSFIYFLHAKWKK